MNRDDLVDVFSRIGDALARPALICLIGSVPGIIFGQPERQTGDIDVWAPESDFDMADLKGACAAASVIYDPEGGTDPSRAYLKVINPGTVILPTGFEVDKVGRFGLLTVTMPPPSLMVAAKLVRSEDRDLEDVVWWSKERALTLDMIKDAIGSLPDERDREVADGNTVIVDLVGRRTRNG